VLSKETTMTELDAKEEAALTRRRAMTILAGAGAALAFGCGSTARTEAEDDAGRDGGPDRAAGDAGKSSDGGEGADTGTCEATPEGEIGPYFADDSASGFERSDVTANIDGTGVQEGVPLTLTITVLDTKKGCAPYVGAQIDMWQCNASGVYSDISSEGTSTESYLRGYQLTNAKGVVVFKTIIPGWYSGRTTHIHLRLRSTYSEASSTSDGANTTQLFFDQTLIDTLASSVSPYKAEGQNPTTNATDRVYSQQVKGATLLKLVGNSTSGYTAAITITLPITASYDASTPTMGGGMGDGGMMGLFGEGGPMGTMGEGGTSGG
jgi:protocatechuate 3,4-dioxygenase beta subunit